MSESDIDAAIAASFAMPEPSFPVSVYRSLDGATQACVSAQMGLVARSVNLGLAQLGMGEKLIEAEGSVISLRRGVWSFWAPPSGWSGATKAGIERMEDGVIRVLRLEPIHGAELLQAVPASEWTQAVAMMLHLASEIRLEGVLRSLHQLDFGNLN